jgi:hypothetical protein
MRAVFVQVVGCIVYVVPHGLFMGRGGAMHLVCMKLSLGMLVECMCRLIVSTWSGCSHTPCCVHWRFYV